VLIDFYFQYRGLVIHKRHGYGVVVEYIKLFSLKFFDFVQVIIK
jgi:hypothetical protein